MSTLTNTGMFDVCELMIRLLRDHVVTVDRNLVTRETVVRLLHRAEDRESCYRALGLAEALQRAYDGSREDIG